MITSVIVGLALIASPTPRELPKPPPEERLPLAALKNHDFAYEELERMHKLLQSNYTLIPKQKYKK